VAVDQRLPRAYPAIGPAHPLATELSHLRAQVAADPVLAGRTDMPVVIRPRLRGRPRPDGGWAIDRFYWSAQWWERGAPPRFRARTLIYEPRRGEAAIFEFPADPSLPAAAAERSPLRDPAAQVLRYIPLTRITFRAGDVVGKFKRRAALLESYARLASAADAVAASGAGFAVAEPLGLDMERGAFFQRRLPGRPVTEAVDAVSAEARLREIGALQRELHELDVPGAPSRSDADVVDRVAADVAWIGIHAPGRQAALAGIGAGVEALLSGDGDGDGERAFCHLDIDPDHILHDGRGFALLDLDDAAVADPCSDLSTMLTILAHHGPELFGTRPGDAGRLAAAYLSGYRDRAGHVPGARRMTAHRARAELARLASRLEKGLPDDAEVAVTVDRLERLLGG
jgi:aminoglycoside phosphotransferase (APT) family kinase protein